MGRCQNLVKKKSPLNHKILGVPCRMNLPVVVGSPAATTAQSVKCGLLNFNYVSRIVIVRGNFTSPSRKLMSNSPFSFTHLNEIVHRYLC